MKNDCGLEQDWPDTQERKKEVKLVDFFSNVLSLIFIAQTRESLVGKRVELNEVLTGEIEMHT